MRPFRGYQLGEWVSKNLERSHAAAEQPFWNQKRQDGVPRVCAILDKGCGLCAELSGRVCRMVFFASMTRFRVSDEQDEQGDDRCHLSGRTPGLPAGAGIALKAAGAKKAGQYPVVIRPGSIRPGRFRFFQVRIIVQGHGEAHPCPSGRSGFG